MSAKSSAEFKRDKTESEAFVSILIVDDDHDFLELMSRQLEKIPETVVSLARSFDEACMLLAHQRFDLVVSDWSLDRDVAPMVFHKVDVILSSRFSNRVSGGKIPIVFMSGTDRIEATRKMNNLENFEAVSFILKRFGPPLIRLLAENILAHA